MIISYQIFHFSYRPADFMEVCAVCWCEAVACPLARWLTRLSTALFLNFIPYISTAVWGSFVSAVIDAVGMNEECYVVVKNEMLLKRTAPW